MVLSPKAVSVDAQGERDEFEPEAHWAAEVIPGGYTRVLVSVPSANLADVHRSLVACLEPPLRVLYVQLTDRLAGTQFDPPRRFVALDVAPQVLDEALCTFTALAHHDGRHQLWIQGRGQDKVVLEETGVIYVYPDDPLFRDALQAGGVGEGDSETMADRDYVRVNFLAEADAQEGLFRQAIGLVPYTS